jgi:prophage regulatory protein
MTKLLTQREIKKKISTHLQLEQSKSLDIIGYECPTVTDRLLSNREVVALSGLSQSTIFRKELEGTFPRRLKLSTRRVGWKLTEIAEWIEQRKPVSV